MKNKILASITALCAALVLVGGFSVTAYAQTPTEETNDSGVIVETEPQPLTPEGNMTLVDDIDGDAAEDKQFIVVKSKGGNYFYIIVDRAAEGENSVHFLNQVDESDLMAIIGEEQTEQPPAVCNCTEKCKAGEVNTACPVCSVNMDSCTGKEAAPEEPTEQEQPQNGMGGLLIFLVVGLLGGGAALYYVKFMKPKQSVKGGTDLDEFDFDEYDEDEPEEETPDAPRASGSSFDEIDDAVRTAKKPEATATERERAAKVFTDMEGTELYEKLMTGSSEMSIRIKGLIEIRLKKPKKDFVVPDNIEDFDIRDYV